VADDGVYVECQDCGTHVRGPLGPWQIADMIRNPYDYVLYCWSCQAARRRYAAAAEHWLDD
jgi:hypothetical protein